MMAPSSIGSSVALESESTDAKRGAAERGGQDLVGRELARYEELQAANGLYVSVFGYRASDFGLNPNLLLALKDNGGSAVGVFTAEQELVGFAYGFAARDASGRDFHYSQSAVVAPNYQGRGVGRELKQLQAQAAKRWGHETMRWTFDPLIAKNGHFNFDALGATGIDFLPNYYARPNTDRVLVEWDLTDLAHRAGGRSRADKPCMPSTPDFVSPTLDNHDWGLARTDGEVVWIAIPATPEAAGDRVATLREALGRTLTGVIEEEHVLIGCTRISDDTSAYLAVPRIRME